MAASRPARLDSSDGARHLLRGRLGHRRPFADLWDVAGDPPGAGGGLDHAARDRLRRPAPLGHASADGGRAGAQLCHGVADPAGGVDRLVRAVLRLADPHADAPRRERGLRRKLLVSRATTAKPVPALPARAASVAAFDANRLVCDAGASTSSTTSPIWCARCAGAPTIWSVGVAAARALAAARVLAAARDVAGQARRRSAQVRRFVDDVRAA